MTKEKIKGIGGWLILPIAGFIISILLHLVNLLEPIGGVYTISDLVLIALIGYTLFLIFKKDRLAPKFAIVALWAGFLVNLIYTLEGIFAYTIAIIIWTMYFIESKRVKNTFVK